VDRHEARINDNFGEYWKPMAKAPTLFRDRILVLGPSSADATLSRSILDQVDVPCDIRADLPDGELDLDSGLAAIVLTGEASESDPVQRIAQALKRQPPWSDIPILFVSRPGADSAAYRAMELLGNVTVLERPLREATLLSALRAAIRARRRQYELRDQVEALRLSDERFELVTQATEDAIWDLDLLSSAPSARQFAQGVFGWAACDVASSSEAWKSRLHPEDRERAVASLHQALAGTVLTWQDEYRFLVPDGSYVHILDRGRIIRDPTGQPVRVVGAMMDISERKRAEEARALHTAIVESTDDAIIAKTLDGTIRSWNPGAERLFGHTASEAIGQHISLIIPSDKVAEEAQILDRLRRGERIDHFETIRVTKHGRRLNISLTTSPVWDGNGRVVGASKVARDITARKQAEVELREQDQRLQLLWESAAVLLTTDKPHALLAGVFQQVAPHVGVDGYLNYRVTEAGDALVLEAFAGFSKEELRSISHLQFGQTVCGAVAAQLRPIAVNNIQQSDDAMVQAIKLLGVRTFVCNPLIAEGRLLGTLAFASRDKNEFDADELEFLQTICRYVAAAYERVRLIQQLRDTDQRKDEFLATLAHELRNPLAPIRNALEIMRVTGVDAATVHQAARSMIERQLGQMVRLIDDLLDVSRITRGRLELRKERVELAAVIKSAVDTSRPLIEAAGHELDVTLPPVPIYLDADPVRLAQVFSNLLNNAARYMNRGGRIWLTATDRGEEVVVSVRDTGIGIPVEALATIFDMFTQVDQSLEQSQGGLGIGLTLVKRLVELHGGRVEARSDGPGKGAELTARLPVAKAHAVPQPAIAHNRWRANNITRRILVADDNRDAAESMGMLLRLMGNEVRTVHDGLQAVEEAAAFQPDVILLDIGMPRLNGYDAARRIRAQQWSDGAILVALTGWGQEEDKRRASEAGFDRHVTKPMNPADLERLITEGHAD
jgi:PAS domain S-box-containing protein